MRLGLATLNALSPYYHPVPRGRAISSFTLRKREEKVISSAVRYGRPVIASVTLRRRGR